MSSTRDALMDRAEFYIRTGGYSSFSFRDLAKDLAIKSASVHYHFPTKTDLGTAVMQRYNDRFKAALPDPSLTTLTAPEHLRHYIMMFYTEMMQNQSMCLCAVLSVEQMLLQPALTDTVDAFYTLNLDWLTSVFQLSPQPALPKAQAVQRATQVLATLQGALIGASARTEADYFILAAKALYKDLFGKDLRFPSTPLIPKNPDR
ncbi:MAG: TetR/AcrR family transcriptional regulator [Reinekea sp.]|nr:TetR/AcrR family transcriptional regulator [Reinekea sp.]